MIIGYQLLAKVIYPYVMGKLLELSPVTVLFSILCGAEVGGLAGMFVAVPIAASIKAVFNKWMELNGHKVAREE